MTQKRSTCLRVPRILGEEAVRLVEELKIVNKKLKITGDEGFIYIPLLRQPSKVELKTLKRQVPNSELSKHTFLERKKRAATLVESLEKNLPPQVLASIPRAMDFVGDIAVIEISPKLDPYKNVIGKAILDGHRNVRTVLAKASAVSGTYRLREFSVVAGEPRTETVHREYGCKYHVDLAKAYFSPRLSYEHSRVASLVNEGETVVDLFAGVGPFAILIGKTHANVKVYAVDLNPHAFRLLEKNVRVNRVEGKVFPLLGDAKKIVEMKFSEVADRVIMNLPEKSMEFVGTACKALKRAGGIVHFYSFMETSESLEDLTQRFTAAVEKSERKVEKILFSRRVRATAPYEWQFVFDVKIR